MDWTKEGAIATTIGVLVAIIGIVVTVIISKKNKDKSKINKQVIKGRTFKGNKITQENPNDKDEQCENEQIIQGKDFSDNEINQK